MRAAPLPPAPMCRVAHPLNCTCGPRQGAFEIPYKSALLRVIASDASEWEEAGFAPPGWEHVSVSLPHRCPTWDEMEFIRSLWWRDDETVIQLHVPKAKHINFHPYCLHLWKPIGVEIPLPPPATVGPTKENPCPVTTR